MNSGFWRVYCLPKILLRHTWERYSVDEGDITFACQWCIGWLSSDVDYGTFGFIVMLYFISQAIRLLHKSPAVFFAMTMYSEYTSRLG